MEKLLKILPERVAKNIIRLSECQLKNLTEIRLRVSFPIYFYFGRDEYGIGELGLSKCDGYVFTREEAEEMWIKLCDGSPYSAVKNQKEGFITIDGNRIGFVGKYNVVNEEIRHLEKISSFCIRVKHEKKGCANKIYKHLYENNQLMNTLIISPPGCGKTTLLRDITRLLSFDGNNVALIDERDEIAALKDGVPTVDIGKRCDVYSGINKTQAIENSLRSMKPDVFILDEIGNNEFEIIKKAVVKGVGIIATLHGKSLEDIKELEKYFQRFIFLSDKFGVGTVECVYNSLFEKKICC